MYFVIQVLESLEAEHNAPHLVFTAIEVISAMDSREEYADFNT